ncbi:MAG: glycerophosphodiester phosphodiesterase [Alistipes sp.]|nr:glycerophosphodiester phosphodiesterase [Alistipes sp.]
MKRFITLFFAVAFAFSAFAQNKTAIEVLGHRGGLLEAEENTMIAFETAYSKGVRSFETDVRMTADNELIISHDDSLVRTCGLDVNVENTMSETLVTYTTLKGNPILFVEDLTIFFGQRKINYIEWEMKSNNYSYEQLKLYCDKLYHTVMPSKPKKAIYVFSSFDERAIEMMKTLHPDAECMFISNTPMNEQLVRKAQSLGVKRVGARLTTTTRKDMENAHKHGLIVNLWPGKSVEDFLLAVALGSDIACTDLPQEVVKFGKKYLKWVKLQNKDLK